MADFFISYNKADRNWAEWIAWQLEDATYTVIIQAWDFRPGDNFVLDMQRAAEAKRTIIVLSPDYLAAEFTQPEWAAAFAQDPTGRHGILLPIRVRVCDIPSLLRPVVYIDLVGLDEGSAKEALLAGINRARVKPLIAPGFPVDTPTEHVTSQRPLFPPTDHVATSGTVIIRDGTVKGPVVGNNQGNITTTYHHYGHLDSINRKRDDEG